MEFFCPDKCEFPLCVCGRIIHFLDLYATTIWLAVEERSRNLVLAGDLLRFRVWYQWGFLVPKNVNFHYVCLEEWLIPYILYATTILTCSSWRNKQKSALAEALLRSCIQDQRRGIWSMEAIKHMVVEKTISCNDDLWISFYQMLYILLGQTPTKRIQEVCYCIVVQFLFSKIGSTSIIRSSGVMTCWRIVGSGWSGLSHQIARSPDHPSSAVQFWFITMSMEPCRWFDSADMTTNSLSRHGQRLEVNGVSFRMSRASMLPTTPVTACSSWRSMMKALSRQSPTPMGLIDRESLSFKPYVRCTLFAFFYLSLDFFILFFPLVFNFFLFVFWFATGIVFLAGLCVEKLVPFSHFLVGDMEIDICIGGLMAKYSVIQSYSA